MHQQIPIEKDHTIGNTVSDSFHIDHLSYGFTIALAPVKSNSAVTNFAYLHPQGYMQLGLTAREMAPGTHVGRDQAVDRRGEDGHITNRYPTGRTRGSPASLWKRDRRLQLDSGPKGGCLFTVCSHRPDGHYSAHCEFQATCRRRRRCPVGTYCLLRPSGRLQIHTSLCPFRTVRRPFTDLPFRSWYDLRLESLNLSVDQSGRS